MSGIAADLYERVRRQLAELGHGGDYTWSQGLRAPETAEDFAQEYTWVVLNSGMKNTVAQKIWDRVRPLLLAGQPIAPAFGHRGKVAAIEDTWRRRVERLAEFRATSSDADAVVWCETLPWIGAITKYHLAKNLGADVAKPDRWLARLAKVTGETVDGLCRRLALETGDRVATVDVVLWRACAVDVLVIENGEIAFRASRSPP